MLTQKYLFDSKLTNLKSSCAPENHLSGSKQFQRTDPNHICQDRSEIQSMKNLSRLFQMEGLSPPATGVQLTAATDVAIRQKDQEDPEHLQFTENHKLCLLFIIFVETQK